jgi:hypothetical protein
MLFELRRYEPRFRSLLPRAWTDAIRLLHPEERIQASLMYFLNAFPRGTSLRIEIPVQPFPA